MDVPWIFYLDENDFCLPVILPVPITFPSETALTVADGKCSNSIFTSYVIYFLHFFTVIDMHYNEVRGFQKWLHYHLK